MSKASFGIVLSRGLEDSGARGQVFYDCFLGVALFSLYVCCVQGFCGVLLTGAPGPKTIFRGMVVEQTVKYQAR